MKYTAKIHTNANTDHVTFIGEVSSNSIKELKESARKHALSWNERGRLHLTIDETGREMTINP